MGLGGSRGGVGSGLVARGESRRVGEDGGVEAGVIELVRPRRGHFELGTGFHGDVWLDLDALFLRPALLEPHIGELAEQLREHQVELLPTALLEKEAFRALFAVGGDFVSLEASGVAGVATARANAGAYVDAVLEVVAGQGRTEAA